MSPAEWFQRLLVGDSPWLFLVEVVYRALIVYLFLLVAMRAMGKRMAAKLGIAELAVILMLGAAISAPIQMPTEGILPALVVLTTVAGLQRGLSWWSYRSSKVETTVHGDAVVLVEDGRLDLERLDQTKISREMLLSELRAKGVRELGELRRVYVEPAGGLSLVFYKRPRPGLSISPEDGDPGWRVRRGGDLRVCWRCGAPHGEDQDACSRCAERKTVAACLPAEQEA
ncbi:DUF421 domain-containing protein [Luteibacter sp. NPDC031894]|jgi:uncharacterized membrane protein YcaP (DUF421 family)|uniref:DUF421 domain-containing protein n=1 Tax=Luteibacter sp. NPDC031894 TaxID=3390572 RepID=UPI003CFCF38A